ncbi:hypothetical protein TSOC_010610 [Tetrabaena socialis]|uniref:C2H2-type domain-containing protein n=1 Tax=Tetrabaena socialis TaxID=47790 RepID=A0A2J7ZSX1_9CHLO|nr:hypothetical protein TSOC_010610 [Tetrabaena socialis]|eukprot:PNH03340.1 hypothetical protein TSOC_010610 [Tetrabaena socialis]
MGGKHSKPAAKLIGYIAARAVLAACTGGTSEAVFLAGDVAGAVFAAADVADAVASFAESSTDLVQTFKDAKADGLIDEQEADKLIRQATETALDAKDAKDAAAELRDELRAMGNQQVKGAEVLAKAKKIMHCKKCGAVGVNSRSHVQGHARAHLHKF